MLAKALTFAATLQAAMAFQEADLSEMIPQELGTMDIVGSTPCIFKLGDSFYDFTPIKIGLPNPSATFTDGNT